MAANGALRYVTLRYVTPLTCEAESKPEPTIGS